MDTPGALTRREILSQPEVWAATLGVVRARANELARVWADGGGYDGLLFTGCGSTYYLSLAAAAAAAQLTGLPARGVPASELLLYPDTIYPARGRLLLVAVSRSGETSETLAAVRAFLAEGPERGALVTLSCYPDQPLADLGEVNVLLPRAQEASVVQTRAFSSLYLAAIATSALWAGRGDLLEQLDAMPAAGQRLLAPERRARVERLAHDADLDQCIFLGSGPQYGLACEASLKMKEASLTRSEPFHFLEFRHGPKSIVTPRTLVVGLLSEAHAAAEREVLAEVEALGGRVLTLGERDADVAFGAGVSELARGPLYLPLLQWLAVQRALSRGLDPDRPKHLAAVVRLEALAAR